ncbi:hypothetical protein Dimus_021439 [Dionaea muscipula]
MNINVSEKKLCGWVCFYLYFMLCYVLLLSCCYLSGQHCVCHPFKVTISMNPHAMQCTALPLVFILPFYLFVHKGGHFCLALWVLFFVGGFLPDGRRKWGPPNHSHMEF